MISYKAVMLVEKTGEIQFSWFCILFVIIKKTDIIDTQKLSNSMSEKHATSNCNTRGKTTESVQYHL